MGNAIVEAITQAGVTATSASWGGGHVMLHRRFETPRSGDHIRWADGTLGRIWTLSDTYSPPGHAHVCDNQGSAFLHADGTHDISGGPFTIVALADLEPTYERHFGLVWNWGPNLAGADMGVEYKIPRPVFRYTGEHGPRPREESTT